MPPKRATKKRKVEDVVDSENDDDDDDSSMDTAPAVAVRPASANKKMSKQEKADARERARASMMGASNSAKKKTPTKKPAAASGTPAKRRKTSNASSPPRTALSSKKPSFVTTTPTAAAAKKPAAATTSKKISNKEAQRQAKERAAQWAAEQQNAKPNTKPKVKVTNTTSKPRPAARAAMAEVVDLAAANNTRTNTVPTPPRATTFGITTPVFAQPAAASFAAGVTGMLASVSPTKRANNHTMFSGNAIPKMDTGVTVTAAASRTPTKNDDDDIDDDVEEATSFAGKIKGIFVKNGPKVLLPLVLVAGLLWATGNLVYNPRSGMLMIVGPTRMRFVDNVPYHTLGPEEKLYTTEDNTGPCYLAADFKLLSMFDSDELNDYVKHNNKCPKPSEPSLVCPPGHLCYRGQIFGCQAPAFYVDPNAVVAPGSSMECLLRPDVAATYQQLVDVIQGYSVQHLCHNRDVDAVTPKSYYDAADAIADIADIADIIGGDSAAVALSTPKVEVAATEEEAVELTSGIPLYAWTTLFRALDNLPEEIEGIWNFETLAQTNSALQQLHLVVDDKLVGLASEVYGNVESTKLPLSCKVSRKLVGSFDALGRFSWMAVLFLFRTFWYCLKTHPYITLTVTAVMSAVQYYRYRKARAKAQLKRVNEIRLLALDELQAALESGMTPGSGMKAGEVAVVHLRDSLSFRLFPDDEAMRHEFCYVLWPLVIRNIRKDNRVHKMHRHAGGAERELWMWVATKTPTSTK